MIRYLEIAFVAYPVTDLARARGFYENVLGLTPNAPPKPGLPWVEYDLGPGTLAIGSSPHWPPSRDGASAALEVENFEAAVAAVREKGAEIFIGPLETPVCHMVGVRDPDGNRIVLHKRKAR